MHELACCSCGVFAVPARVAGENEWSARTSVKPCGGDGAGPGAAASAGDASGEVDMASAAAREGERVERR